MTAGVNQVNCYNFGSNSGCQCFSGNGTNISEFYQQYNSNDSEYVCCDNVNITMKDFWDTNPGDITNRTELLNYINDNTSLKNMSGCCYQDVVGSEKWNNVQWVNDNHFSLLADNTETFQWIYQNLIRASSSGTDTSQPVVDVNSDLDSITCGNTYYPLLLQFKSKNSLSINYSSLYICNENTTTAKWSSLLRGAPGDVIVSTLLDRSGKPCGNTGDICHVPNGITSLQSIYGGQPLSQKMKYRNTTPYYIGLGGFVTFFLIFLVILILDLRKGRKRNLLYK